MNMTEFWFKLVDMTKSDAPVFSLGGRALTEKQLLWVIALVILIIVVLLLRSAILWIFNPTPSKKEVMKVTETPVDTTKTEQASVSQTVEKESVTATAATPNPLVNSEKVEQTTPQGSPADLLADTSDKKRSMQDYVTPDAVTSEVIKQPITNDYPYQTLKPDPTKVGAATTPAQPEPAKEVVIEIPVVASAEPPVIAAETPAQPIASPVSSPTPQPAPADPTTVTTVLPGISEEPAIPTNPGTTSPTSTTSTSTVLPPLPEKEPVSHMVVGVADEKSEPIKKTTFNPVDPIIP